MFDRKSHWESIYGDKDPVQVSWYQQKPVLSLQLIHNSSLALDAPVIDIGGGASELVDCLYDEGYSNLSVLDISKKALDYAKNRLGDKAAKIKWYEEDVTLFIASQKYSLWHDRAVFHFLTNKSDRVKYVDTIKSSLLSGGYVVIAAFALDGPEKCSGLDIVKYDADKLSAELGEGFKLLDQKNEIHLTPQNKEQKFVYFHFIRE